MPGKLVELLTGNGYGTEPDGMALLEGAPVPVPGVMDEELLDGNG